MNHWIIPGLKYRETKVLEFEKIVEIICTHFKTDIKTVIKKNRDREFVSCRHMCFYFLRKYTKKTLKEIGNYFKLDHSTIIHGCQKVESFLSIKDAHTIKIIFSIENIFMQDDNRFLVPSNC